VWARRGRVNEKNGVDHNMFAIDDNNDKQETLALDGPPHQWGKRMGSS